MLQPPDKNSIDWLKVNTEIAMLLCEHANRLPARARSARAISNKTGISKTQIGNWLAKNIGDEVRQRKSIERVLNLIDKPKTTKDHIESMPNTEISKALSYLLNETCQGEKTIELDDEEASPYVDNRYWKIMLLASQSDGTSEQFLRERLGDQGILLAEKLVEQNVLEKQNNNYKTHHSVEQKNFSYKTLKQLAGLLVTNCFDPEKKEMDRNASHIMTYIKNVDKQKFLNEFRPIFRTLTKQVEEIAERNKGSETMFITAACDTLLEEK